MKNLWLFFVRYNAFFWFILFFGLSLFLVIKHNSFQNSQYLSSSNKVIGGLYKKVNSWKEYLALEKQNKKLSEENAKLRFELYKRTTSILLDSTDLPLDSAQLERYSFIPAKVINNSIHQKNNYLTLDKGNKEGVKPGMGVISPDGIVGITLHVSENFSTVQSLLHAESKVSVTLDSTGIFASLVWGENVDARYAMVEDIPNHIKVRKGGTVYTSGFSLFPEGLTVGRIVETEIVSKNSFKSSRVALSTDFASLQHVYVVEDMLGEEKEELEESEEVAHE